MNPLTLNDLTPDLRARFWSKVNKDGECWEWTRSLDSHGYGTFRVAGFKGSPASRISYILHFGDILPNQLVCHKCDNPKCVRPDHLFLGTKRDNILDWHNKGNAWKGTAATRGKQHHNSKLTEEGVAEIRRLHREGSGAQRLAKRFGVHKTTIEQIFEGKTWKHVPIPALPDAAVKA